MKKDLLEKTDIKSFYRDAAERELSKRKDWIDYHLANITENAKELPRYAIDIAMLYGLRLAEVLKRGHPNMDIYGKGSKKLEVSDNFSDMMNVFIFGDNFSDLDLSAATYTISGVNKSKPSLVRLVTPNMKLARVEYKCSPAFREVEHIDLYDATVRHDVQTSIAILNQKTGLSFKIQEHFDYP